MDKHCSLLIWYKDVILNLHLANGAYVDPSGGLSNSLERACRKLAKSNVQINVTQEFFNKKDLITWLNQNDINLYWYKTPNVPGVSGSVDRALASKKPFGVNDSIISISLTVRSNFVLGFIFFSFSKAEK